MRVASRRLRSAIRDFTPYLRKRPLAAVLKELKDIADALGEVRDQDVAIMALEKMVHHAPAQFESALKQFIDVKREVRDRSREELKAVLEQTELKQLEMDFIASVDAATAIRDQSKPQITFQEMSRVVILGRLKELEKLSVGLFQPSEIETLHDMRIAAKRLRYAIELFQQCWRSSIAGYAKRTARIQTALGDVHDCDVWIESVGKEIIIARKQKQHDQVAALMWLLSHLVKVRTKHLRTAFVRWCEWETQAVSDKLRTVLSGAPKA
jgi:CHAD domain-containing protein